jgi:hypothetical protein
MPDNSDNEGTDEPRIATRQDIDACGAAGRVADWRLGHMDSFDDISAPQFRRDTEARRDWIQAAFYIGLAAPTKWVPTTPSCTAWAPS